MRICFFGSSQNVHLERLLPGLAARGHQVRLVCHHPTQLPGVFVEQFEVPGPSLRYPHRWSRRWTQYLREHLRKNDVVVLFFLQDWGFTPEMIQEGCFVAHPQGSDIVLPPEVPPHDPELVQRRREWLQAATAVGTCGPRFAKVVAKYANLSEDTLLPLPLGVDTEQFRPAERGVGGSDGATQEPLCVGYFKGFHPVYGPEYLIRAVPAILAEHPAARFEMLGDGPQADTCQKLAQELGVAGAMRWIPRQPHSALPPFLARWDLTVVPSLQESFGVACLEAAAAGLPVVASDVGGLPDTVCHGRTGLLVPPRDVNALARAISDLLGDARRRRQMGATSRQWVCQHWSWQHTLNSYEQSLHRARERALVGI
jgi:glycosyltransferase involved in cell wall biosynthesis